MQIELNVNDDEEYIFAEELRPVTAEVLAVIMHKGRRLYAVTADVGGAPWYALVHQDSDVVVADPFNAGKE